MVSVPEMSECRREYTVADPSQRKWFGEWVSSFSLDITFTKLSLDHTPKLRYTP
jgi:hypothetical protein